MRMKYLITLFTIFIISCSTQTKKEAFLELFAIGEETYEMILLGVESDTGDYAPLGFRHCEGVARSNPVIDFWIALQVCNDGNVI
jgi:hypothetical protein